jgi:VWFA-related protein
VEVSVVASDAAGRQAGELTANDFEVKDNGIPRRIEGFQILRPSTELLRHRVPTEYPESNRPMNEAGSQQPVNVVLLDTAHLDPEFQPWAVAQLEKWFSYLRSGDDVALYELTREGLKLRHQFSHSAVHLTAAIAPEAVHWDAATKDFKVDVTQSRVLDAAVAQDLERETKDSEFCDQRNAGLASSIAKIADWMRQFSGRKNLFWISSSFPPVAAQSRTLHTALVRMLQSLDEVNVAVYPVEVRSAVPPVPFLALRPGSERSLPRARRRAMPEQFRSMRWIAGATGGVVVSNRSQLGEALFDRMRQTRFSYLISFDAPSSDMNGQFHRLQVTLKRHDLNWIARQTYFAGPVAASSSAGNEAFEASLFPKADLALSVRVGHEQSGSQPVIVRLPAETAGLDRVRVYLEEGGVHGVMAQRAASISKTGDRSGIDELVLAVPPRGGRAQSGMWRLRAEDQSSGRRGSLTLCHFLSKMLASGNPP